MPIKPPSTDSTTASTKKLEQHLARERADRETDPDLARALGDVDQHDVHDADAADQQADGGDGAEQRGQRAGGAAHGLGDLLHVAHAEIVLGSGSDPSAFAEQALDLLLQRVVL